MSVNFNNENENFLIGRQASAIAPTHNTAIKLQCLVILTTTKTIQGPILIRSSATAETSRSMADTATLMEDADGKGPLPIGRASGFLRGSGKEEDEGMDTLSLNDVSLKHMIPTYGQELGNRVLSSNLSILQIGC